jgi:hypothetical protein
MNPELALLDDLNDFINPDLTGVSNLLRAASHEPTIVHGEYESI